MLKSFKLQNFRCEYIVNDCCTIGIVPVTKQKILLKSTRNLSEPDTLQPKIYPKTKYLNLNTKWKIINLYFIRNIENYSTIMSLISIYLFYYKRKSKEIKIQIYIFFIEKYSRLPLKNRVNPNPTLHDENSNQQTHSTMKHLKSTLLTFNPEWKKKYR